MSDFEYELNLRKYLRNYAENRFHKFETFFAKHPNRNKKCFYGTYGMKVSMLYPSSTFVGRNERKKV